MNIRQQLLSAKRRYKTVKAGDCEIRIQSLTEGQRCRVDERAKGDQAKAIAGLIVESVVDDDGDQLFGDDDLSAVIDMDCRISQTLFNAIIDFNGPVESLEDTVKNSETIQENASLSS